MKQIVCLSGGKDSSAMALRLVEVEPGPFIFFCTPTGDELPELIAHWTRLETLLGQAIEHVRANTLAALIEVYGALPNWRQRWCTRQLKIEPAIAYVRSRQPALLLVGLRADEEEREGIISRDVACRFPLREWGWGLAEVRRYLQERGVKIPERTDCARCYGQRLSEWRRLLEKHPALYAAAEADEAKTGHTYRSSGRDSQPAALKDLRRVFERQGVLPMDEDEDEERGACRVCRL